MQRKRINVWIWHDSALNRVDTCACLCVQVSMCQCEDGVCDKGCAHSHNSLVVGIGICNSEAGERGSMATQCTFPTWHSVRGGCGSCLMSPVDRATAWVFLQQSVWFLVPSS